MADRPTHTLDTSLPSFGSCGCQPRLLHAAASVSSTTHCTAAAGSGHAPTRVQCRCMTGVTSDCTSPDQLLAATLLHPVAAV